MRDSENFITLAVWDFREVDIQVLCCVNGGQLKSLLKSKWDISHFERLLLWEDKRKEEVLLQDISAVLSLCGPSVSIICDPPFMSFDLRLAYRHPASRVSRLVYTKRPPASFEHVLVADNMWTLVLKHTSAGFSFSGLSVHYIIHLLCHLICVLHTGIQLVGCLVGVYQETAY